MVAVLLPRPTLAQDTSPATTASAPASAPAPASQPGISLTEIPAQSQAIRAELRATADSGDVVTQDIAGQLPLATDEIAARSQETSRILNSNPSLQDLSGEESFWESRAATFDLWNKELLDHGATLDARINQLQQQLTTWQQTLDSARKADAAHQSNPEQNASVPADTLSLIQNTVTALRDALAQADDARASVLSLETQIAQQDDIISKTQEDIREQRNQATREIFTRNGQPLWELRLNNPPAHRPPRPRVSWTTQFKTLLNYVQNESDRFIIQGILFVLLALLLFGARARFKSWQAAETTLAPAAPVFDRPLAGALILALIFGLWIHAEAPQVFWNICSVVAIFPATILLRRLTEHYFAPVIYALVSFFFADQFRPLLLGLSIWPRMVFLAELLAAAMFLTWFIRTRSHGVESPHLNRLRVVLIACRIALLLVAVAFVANAVGYTRLSFLLGNAVMRSSYLGMVIYTSLSIADGLVIVLLHLRFLSRLSAIKQHAPILRRRTRRVLNWAAVILWLYLSLQLLYITSPVLDAVRAVLTTPAHIGGFSISLGQIISGGITIWASFAISRFIRFLLEQDVYPHVELPRGLNTAVSMIIHYLVLVVGFGIAIAFLGFPVTQLTILTGAFGVGLGFGLQTIINNFFSGLIVLAERPVRVGDVIEMDGIAGTVVRIGIRATVYRTADGSEIIMPNARLIAERVINWTFSDRDRGFDIPVSVDASADPKHVIELLQNTARNFPGIGPTSPVTAQLTGFSGGAFNFTLSAYAKSIDNWKQVRSDLALALQVALKKENIPMK